MKWRISMSDKKYHKTVGSIVLSTHERSGFENLFPNKDEFGRIIQTIKESREKIDGQPLAINILRDMGKDFQDSGKVPAAVKITFDDGREAIAIGLKKEGDQRPLEVRLVKLPNGQRINLEPPMTLEFDKESDPKKGMAKGAVSNDSAVMLINEVSNLIEGKSRNKVQVVDKTSAIGDDVLRQAEQAVKPDGNYVSSRNPAVVAKNSDPQSFRSV